MLRIIAKPLSLIQTVSTRMPSIGPIFPHFHITSRTLVTVARAPITNRECAILGLLNLKAASSLCVTGVRGFKSARNLRSMQAGKHFKNKKSKSANKTKQCVAKRFIQTGSGKLKCGHKGKVSDLLCYLLC